MKKYIQTYDQFQREIFKKGMFEIYEAFKTPVDVTWKRVSNSGLVGEFTLSRDYRIESDLVLHDFRTFKFRTLVNGEYTTNLLNDGSNDIFKVYPTIKHEAKWILDEIKPNGLIFTAIDTSTRRKQMYEEFCIEYTTQNSNYFYDSSTEDGKTIYLIFKKHITANHLLEVVKWCNVNYFNII